MRTASMGIMAGLFSMVLMLAPAGAQRPAGARSESLPCADTSAVVASRLKERIPGDPAKIRKLLWNTFANKPAEEQFSGCPADSCEERYQLFAAALIGHARAAGLDSTGLGRCLAAVSHSNPGLCYLPVGVYQAEQGHSLAWILVVKWEGRGAPVPVGHVRVFALDAMTGRRIGFVTCD